MAKIALASVFILTSLFGILFGVGMLMLSRSGLPGQFMLPTALGFATLVVLVQFAVGPILIDRIMAIRWSHPSEISPAFSDWMSATCATYRIAVPRFGIIEDQGPNAFTYGNGAWNGRVVISRGLITMLSDDELKSVVGHELGHIRNRDFIFMTLVQAIVLATYVIFRMSRYQFRKESILIVPISFLAYQVSYYLSLLISRLREYMADYASAQIMQDANPLASALVKISYGLADSTGGAFQSAYNPGAAKPKSGRIPSGAGMPPVRAIAGGLPPVQAATASASVYDYNAPLPDLSRARANADIPPEVMAKVQSIQAKANRAEVAPLMGVLGMPVPHGGVGLAEPDSKSKSKGMKKLGPSSIGAMGICGISGALSAVAWMQPGGGIDTGNFAKAARWELFNPWARIAELVSTHPLTARRIQALMKLNVRWNIAPTFDFSQVQSGRYPRFMLDLLLVVGPYLLAVAGGFIAHQPMLHLGGIQQVGVALVCFFSACALIHFAMYPGGFVRNRILTMLSELNVSHMNPKPVVVEGVFTGYIDAVTPWAHNFVLQDDTGFIATQYRQPLGAEFLMGLFKSGRSLGRPVKVEGWYRRFGHPILEISSFQFLDTMEQHRANFPIYRFVLLLLGLICGLGLTALHG